MTVPPEIEAELRELLAQYRPHETLVWRLALRGDRQSSLLLARRENALIHLDREALDRFRLTLDDWLDLHGPPIVEPVTTKETLLPPKSER